MHPASIVLNILHFIGVVDIWQWMKVLVRNAMGSPVPDERNYIPEAEAGKAVFWARVHLAIYAVTLAAALWWQSILPFMLIGGPRIYGAWHMFMTGMIQPRGLAEDVLDHRLSNRTCLMNPVSRWVYWNMNYHVEHHMFPMVPYHPAARHTDPG